VATPGAIALMEAHGIDPLDLLRRHVTGDWGGLCDEDKQANEDALRTGGRLFSAYGDGDARLWLTTEATDDAGDRCATTYLRPDEY
jgi:hypothetical protein